MLLTLAVLLVLAVWSAVQLLRRRGGSAARLAAAAAAVVVVYGAVLVGVGLASRPIELPAGASKCFDDWCAAMVQARTDGARAVLLVDVRLQNRGRGRVMRSDLATAYVVVDRGSPLRPRNGDALRTTRLGPGESMDVELAFDLPPALHATRFVVVESDGGPGPGLVTIGGESSPFHSPAGWPLALAGA